IILGSMPIPVSATWTSYRFWTLWKSTPFVRKFDRVFQEIPKDLLQPCNIALHKGARRCQMKTQTLPLFLNGWFAHFDCRTQHSMQIYNLNLKFQLVPRNSG